MKGRAFVLLSVIGLAILVVVGWPLAAQEDDRDDVGRERNGAAEREADRGERPEAERRERAERYTSSSLYFKNFAPSLRSNFFIVFRTPFLMSS